MRLGLVLSLVSALQICHQSVLSTAFNDLKDGNMAVANAAFPLGKFISTIFLSFFPTTSRKTLRIDAYLLIVGSILSLIPSYAFLTIGRFLVGCGAGLGFVAATVLLFEMVPFKQRPSHFFVMGMAFALSTSLMNFMHWIVVDVEYVIVITNLFTLGSGLLYLLIGPVDNDYDRESTSFLTPYSGQSEFPQLLVYALMILNVSIGVPLGQSYSTIIFEKFGADQSEASTLSLTFPIVQLLVIILLYRSVNDRRILVVGGFILSVCIQAILLMTSSIKYLPGKHSLVANCLWMWLLNIISCVPCNTALCLVAEQYGGDEQQMKKISRARALMWILAAISTATFPYTMDQHGFTKAFAPYALISIAVVTVVAIVYVE